jgi:hypothetical protein
MKPFTLAAVVVFTLVSLAQLLRVVMGWSVLINGITIPPWVSLVACVVAGLLAAMVWREHRVRAQ